MTVYEEIHSNKRKSVFLLLLFFIIIGLLGYTFGIFIGDIFVGLIYAVVISIFMTLVGYYAGDNAILTLSHAIPADKKKYPHLVNTVEGLSIAGGIPTPRIYIIEDSAINAFATGRDPKHASVTVTTGAIERLNRTELEGVIAHEISHIKNFDIRYMLLVVILVGVIAMLSDIFRRSMIYGRHRGNSRGRGSGNAIVLLIGLILAILAPLIAQLIKLAVSRKREFLADANGALLTRYPDGLANALKKIRDDKEPLVEAANKATAHLYIENPLRTFGGKLNSLFSTHPDINERIKRLGEM